MDTEVNGIELHVSDPENTENVGQFHSPEAEDVVEGFVTSVYGRGRGVGNTIWSSLISSVSSTKKLMSGRLSGNQFPSLQTAFVNEETADSVSLTPPGLRDLTDASRWISADSGLQFLTDSTPVFPESPNETMQQLTSTLSPEEIGAVVIVSFVVPFILLSNIVVIICVVRFRRLHTPTNYFITSLAAVDIFVALATPFGIVVEVFNFGGVVLPEDAVLCLLPNRMLMMACGVSVLTLAAIAYDRQTALVSPLEYVRVMTYRKVACMVSLIWMYSAFIAWLPLMAGWYSLPSADSSCSANLIHGQAPVLFLAAIFVPSCVAIFVCYFRIFLVARHHAKAIAAVELAVHRHLQVKFIIKDTKYAKTLALVIGAFLLLWLPYLLFILAQTVVGTKLNVWIHTYLTLLTVFNSGINPWLYAFKNNELKAAFKRLFRELCTNKFCSFSDRRTSLISAISGTPRLSRTDSRAASFTTDFTQLKVNEKLQRSLVCLDQEFQERGREERQQRRQSMIDLKLGQSASSWPRHPHRQATSCSNLAALGDPATGGTDSSSKRFRSFSVDLTLACEGHRASGVGTIGGHVIAHPGGLAWTHLREVSNPKCVNTNRDPPATLSVTNPVPSLSHSNAQLSQLSLPRQSPTIDSDLPVSDQPKLHHQTSLPHKSTSPTDQVTEQGPILPYAHSVDFLKETAQPAVSWTETCCQGNLPDAFTQTYPHHHHHHHHNHHHHHPVHSLNLFSPKSSSQCPQYTLTHTHSCPIFEPIMSYSLLFPQRSSVTSSSHLRKAASALLEGRLDFVSRVHREADNSRTDQYVV